MRRMMEASAGKTPTTSARRLTALFQALQRVRGMPLGAVLRRDRHGGQHAVLAVVHELAELGPAGAERVGVQPGIRPLAGERAVEEGAGAPVNVLAQRLQPPVPSPPAPILPCFAMFPPSGAQPGP